MAGERSGLEAVDSVMNQVLDLTRQPTRTQQLLSNTAVDDIFCFESFLWIGGISSATAFVISMAHISQHLRYNMSKEIKRCTLRILLLVPLYSVDCFFALVLNTDKGRYIELLKSLREFYEAFVLSAFMQLILTFLGRREGDDDVGGPFAVGEAFCKARRQPSHMSVNKLLGRVPVPFGAGISFVAQVLLCILQYAVVMVAVLAANITIWHFEWEKVPVKVFFFEMPLGNLPFAIKAVSSGLALYSLIFFYFEARQCEELNERLVQIRPEMKFLSVKMILFFTFFQTLVVGNILTKIGVFNSFENGKWTAKLIGEAVQSFLLCVEMLVFALWHIQAYPVKEFNVMEAEARLKAAIRRGTCSELTNAIDEAVRADLDDESELLHQAKTMKNEKYPQVGFMSRSADFVLTTSQAAKVALRVDMEQQVLMVFRSDANEVDGIGAAVHNGSGPVVHLSGGFERAITNDSACPAAPKVERNRPASACWQGCMQDCDLILGIIQRRLNLWVKELCCPHGEVGFLATFAMFNDILNLLLRSRRLTVAARTLLRALEREAPSQMLWCCGQWQAPTEKEIEEAFEAFDLRGNKRVSEQDLMDVFVTTNLLQESDGKQVVAQMGRMLGGESASQAKSGEREFTLEQFTQIITSEIKRNSSYQGLNDPLLKGIAPAVGQ